MYKTIRILGRGWIRDPKKLKALQITLLFNNQELVLKISSRSQIKDLVRIHFCTLPKPTQYKLRKDLARELKFNQKQFKRAIKINHKAKNIIMQNKELLN